MKSWIWNAAGAAVLGAWGWGCGSGQPIGKWQQELAAYVRAEGNGDVSVLRDAEDSPGRPGFTVISAGSGGIKPFSASRTDVHGVLVGTRETGGARWLYYLVGVDEYEGDMTYFPLEKGKVTDIRLVGLWWNGGRPVWAVGAKDAEAVARYYANAAGRGAPDSGPVVFPNRADRFEFELSGGEARVRHAVSGAEWKVVIDDHMPGVEAGGLTP